VGIVLAGMLGAGSLLGTKSMRARPFKVPSVNGPALITRAVAREPKITPLVMPHVVPHVPLQPKIDTGPDARVAQPNDAVTFYNRGAGSFAKKDYDQAMRDFDEAIRLEPSLVDAYFARGTVLYVKREFDRAIKDFDEAIRLDPKFAVAFCNRGMALYVKQDYDRAIKDFDESLRLDPKDAIAYGGRGWVWFAKKDYNQAIKDCDEAIRLIPTNVDAYQARGAAWYAKQDYDRAIKDYEESIRLDPRDAGSYNGLAWILATCPSDKHRNGTYAVALATKACELTGWVSAHELDTLAAAHAEAGQFEKAVQFQTKALEDPNLYGSIRDECRHRLELYKQQKPYRDG
jgi:Flp pilus assembly protein TadD